MKEVVSVFPSTNFQLHTTRSWNSIGLNDETKQNSTANSDVVVVVIDTGIWPNRGASMTKVLVRLPRSGKVFVKVAKISLATTRSLELGVITHHQQGMMLAMDPTLPQRQQAMPLRVRAFMV